MARTRSIVRYRNRPRARRRSKAGFTVPMAVLGGFAPTIAFAVDGYRVGGFENAFRRIAQRMTGYDSTANVFIWKELMAGIGPIMAGYLVHKAAGRLGINRALSRAGVPIFRI